MAFLPPAWATRKGPRRRPVRIEFCEADVLDAFDDWRRAVGVARVVADSPGGPEVEEPQPVSRPRRSLTSQIESAMARLTVLRGSDQAGPVIGPALDRAVRALDALRPEAADQTCSTGSGAREWATGV